MIKISPSILSCDYSKIGEEFADMKRCGADWLHIDVMDGHFVPNITIGAPLVKCVRKCSDLVFDVHLMISDPQKYIPDFVKAGADVVTFHAESNGDIRKTIELIRSLGAKPALALKPNTPADVAFEYLDELYMVLVMTVEPGFGGQSFMADMMPKVNAVRQEIKRRNLDVNIQVDGGVSGKTAAVCAENGANILVAGSAIFNAPNRKAAVDEIRQIAEENYR